jgi:hypothetical protein
MPGGMRLASIVTLIVICVVVLVGVLGYLIESHLREKGAEPAEQETKGTGT